MPAGESAKDAAEWFDAWMRYAVNFFILANSGAAIATLSYIGSNPRFRCVAVLALLLFVIGIICAGVVILGQLTAAYRSFIDSTTPGAGEVSVRKSWVTRLGDRAEPRTGRLLAAAFIAFILGAIVGLLGLAFAP